MQNPLWRCVDAEEVGRHRLRVVERHRLTGTYRTRTIQLDQA